MTTDRTRTGSWRRGEGTNTGSNSSFHDLFFSCIRVSNLDVVPDCSWEDERTLRDVTDQTSHTFTADIVVVDAVQGDLALLRFIDLAEDVRERRLSSLVLSDNGVLVARQEDHLDIFKIKGRHLDTLSIGITETDVVDPQLLEICDLCLWGCSVFMQPVGNGNHITDFLLVLEDGVADLPEVCELSDGFDAVIEVLLDDDVRVELYFHARHDPLDEKDLCDELEGVCGRDGLEKTVEKAACAFERLEFLFDQMVEMGELLLLEVVGLDIKETVDCVGEKDVHLLFFSFLFFSLCLSDEVDVLEDLEETAHEEQQERIDQDEIMDALSVFPDLLAFEKKGVECGDDRRKSVVEKSQRLSDVIQSLCSLVLHSLERTVF